MAHHPKGQHWRDLGKSTSVALPDKSTGAILDKLHTPRNPDVVEAHGGVGSVGVDGGAKPTQPKTDGGNTAVNEAFNQATKPKRETTRPDQLVAAGITGNFGR